MRVLEWRNYEIHYPRMALKSKWILGRLKRLLPCFILIGISLTGYMYTGQSTPVKIPAVHLRSPKENMKKTPTEPTPTPDPPTRQWVIVVSRNASCNTLALTFVDWKVLMVNGRTARHRHSRCVVLNRDDIERSTTQLHQSDKRQSRLLAAYLYAIQRGAKAILPIMVSGDGSTVQPPKHAATVGPQTGLVATSGGIMFDVATHFGCNRSSHGKHSPSTMSYSLCRHKVAAIQTTAACSGVRTPDPAITSPICDAHAPPVALANARFTPFDFDGALFTSDAFWALPAALVTDPDESLMWSLGVQRLLWLSGNQVVVRRCRTSLSSSASSRLFSTAARLNKWQCRATTMKQCILDLIANNSRLLKEPVTFSYSRWLEVLDKIGYTFPQFSDSFNEGCENVILHAVDHSVSTLRRHLGAGLYAPVPNLDPIVKLYSNTCHHHNVTLPNYIHVNFAQPWTQFNDVLLLVIFNNPHYEAIPYVETLYRPFFPNILYCGPGQIDVNRYPGVSNFTFSFISYGETPDGHVAGAFSYKCMAMALQLDYAVHGYLAAADDLLLVVHTLSELVTKAVWYRPKKSIRIGEISKLRECKLGMCDFYPHWPWWKDYQNATIDALREIANRRGSSAIMRECYQRLLSENGAADRPNGAVSDIYYIPSKLSQEFLEIVDVFLRHKVFLEIGVPTTIRCLVAPTDVQPLKGVTIWDMETRVQPWLHFKTKSLVGKSYWHPLKWGFLARGSTEYSQLYCTKVLPYLHDRLARTID